MFPNLYHLLFPLLTLLSGFQTKMFYRFVVSHARYMTHQAKYAEPPDYVIFFILLSLPLSYVQTFFTAF